MSRNIDKANTVLSRYQEQQAEANGYRDYHSTQRPRDMKQVKTLNEAENWRKVIIREINDKILRINSDANMSNFQIRDLNEELNELCKEKYTYEYHILHNLNGQNYITGGGTINKYIESNSVKIKGYRYFGRARQLSDVQELIERQNEIRATKLKAASDQTHALNRIKELEKRVDMHYFGYDDDIHKPQSHESIVRKQTNEILGDLIDSSDKMTNVIPTEAQQEEVIATKKRRDNLLKVPTTAEKIILIKSGLPVSSEKVQQFLVEKKRKKLQDKYNI